ncbi:MAG: YkvA family protein [Rubrobacteraceae bacterium]
MVGVNLAGWKRWAGRLKSETYALYLAYRDPRVPLRARLFAALVVGYAFSPIDLIPDSIPVLGYLDDLIVVPLGVALAVRMIPKDVLAESRQKAREMVERGERPVSRTAAAIIVILWLALAGLGALLVVRIVRG